jgi:hypothetical protein
MILYTFYKYSYDGTIHYHQPFPFDRGQIISKYIYSHWFWYWEPSEQQKKKRYNIVVLIIFFCYIISLKSSKYDWQQEKWLRL